MGASCPNKCGRWPVATKNMEYPEKLLSADEVKATLSPHMQFVWDAAVKCLYASTDENLAAFKKLCRPAEIILLLRAYADSVASETNAIGEATAVTDSETN